MITSKKSDLGGTEEALTGGEPCEWQRELQHNVTTVEGLEEYLPLTPAERRDLEQVTAAHPMNIPRYYLELIDPGDPHDPVRKMAVPATEELIVAGDMGATTGDPYGDDKHDKGNGILHKYPYTALVVTTEYCSMYCRHCFRKRMVGLPNDQTVKSFRQAASYIAAHPEIKNVVMSGGDPLLLPTSALKSMLSELRGIKHLNYVRIGSRAPVVFPMRFFDDELIELLADFNREKPLYLPTHFNHPREITPTAREAVRRLRSAGVTVNNQAVLLRGVNDAADTLAELMDGLLRIGVNPYYLYQCMPVTRVRHHFQVPLKEGVDLVDAARAKMDGYAKRFKFIIGHDIGKLEICGRIDDKLILKQLHARPGHQDESSRMLVRRLTDNGGWLDDLPECSLSS
ncbi:MAG: KamA family radical SAM protein [Desulfuromonas sp.]|uniref:KamA family radical SAM protein n=1 Tax=Desulfuromonas sp. TaxID=892 RepID=UPI000CC210E6|nr:KamA family radical SAM protein [Desulfuromonas sp.]PLX84769.1 MAG: KamA family radical SAM protein [Desulfuromonas sp.]